MIGEVQEVELEGGRVLRIGTYELDSGDDGEEPEARVFISAGWRSTPLLPFAEQTVDIPAASLPAVLAVLEDIQEASS